MTEDGRGMTPEKNKKAMASYATLLVSQDDLSELATVKSVTT
jgi:hypothetical protein